MQKGAAALAAAVLIVIAVIAGAAAGGATSQYVRIHIRAHSNAAFDQNVKYAVKDAVTELLTPLLAQCESKDKAKAAVSGALADIERAANSALAAGGADYRARARLDAEQFPARSYGGFLLEDGVYDALIIELGSGTGDNWWCVVYPPLCFVGYGDNGGTDIHYRSKLLEIIENFKKSLQN